MTAKPKFSSAPKPAALTPEQSAFIDKGRGKDRVTPTNDEPTHRLSIDLPRRLHARYKSACALAGIKMAPDLIAYIEKRTAELETQNR